MASPDLDTAGCEGPGGRLGQLLALVQAAPSAVEGLRACLALAVADYGWRGGLLLGAAGPLQWLVEPAADVVAPNAADRGLLGRWAETEGARRLSPEAVAASLDDWFGPAARTALPLNVEGRPAGALLFLGAPDFVPAADFEATLRPVLEVAALRLGNEQRAMHFSELSESVRGHYWEMDEHLRFSKFVGLAGGGALDEAAVIGRTRWELAGGDAENDPVWRRHRELLEAKRPLHGFEYATHADGAVHHWRVSGRPVFDRRGVFRGYRGVSVDVSARYNAERRLKESENRFERFTELTADWLWEMDENLRYSWISPKAEAILGEPSSWPVGRRRDEIARTEDDPEAWRRHNEALKRHEPYRDFIVCRDVPGGRRWIRSSGVPLFDERGRFKGYMGTGVDVTELHLADREAERARELLRQAVESVSQSFSLWDADDRLVLCNEVWRQLNAELADASGLGVSFAAHLRGSLRAGVPTEAAGGETWFRARMKRHRNPGAPFEVNRGKGVWTLVSEQRLPDGSTVVLATDISELKRAEAELRLAHDELEERVVARTAELEAANRALRQEIAERERAEAALRISEERFRDFAASSADWFWEMDRELRFTYMSDNVERILGVPPEWHYGKTRRDIFGAEHVDESWTGHLERLDRHEPFRDFTYLRRGDGAAVPSVWLSTSGLPRFDAEGRFLGYRGTGREVTQMIEAERRLRDSEERFRDFAASSADWYWETDVEHRYTYMSQNVERILGVGPEVYYGRRRQDFFDPAQADEEHVRHLRAVERHEPFRDFVFRRLSFGEVDGSFGEASGPHWLSSSGLPHFDGDGRFLGYRGTGRDVTAAVENARTIRESEAHLRLIADNLPVLIAYVDAGRRLTFVNRAAETWLATAAEKLIGRRVADLLPAEVYAKVEVHVEAALAGRPVHYENRLVYPDGRQREVDVVYVPDVAADGRVRGYIVLVRDVSEQRASEAQLRQAQKMEAVGQLTGGIAHDFNNLLTVVLGSLDLLGLELAPESESRAYLEEARHAVAHGALLTQHLLAFARRQSLSPKPTDINALIAGFAPILQRTLGEDVRLTTDLEPALWPATVDGAQLENVLLNLALNARDALPAGGGIAIATGNVVIGDDDAAALEEVTPGPYVVLSLSDDGEGMSAEVQARAVEPFYTTKEVGAGSGLGLSMVFGFVKQSHGHMLIDSAPGAGTTVSLYLPQAGETAPAEAAVAAPADALS